MFGGFVQFNALFFSRLARHVDCKMRHSLNLLGIHVSECNDSNDLQPHEKSHTSPASNVSLCYACSGQFPKTTKANGLFSRGIFYVDGVVQVRKPSSNCQSFVGYSFNDLQCGSAYVSF